LLTWSGAGSFVPEELERGVDGALVDAMLVGFASVLQVADHGGRFFTGEDGQTHAGVFQPRHCPVATWVHKRRSAVFREPVREMEDGISGP
jgi:hypothetical protein